MTPNDDEVFPQIGAPAFLPSFQLNSETLKTFCTRNHHLQSSSSSSFLAVLLTTTTFFCYICNGMIALCLSVWLSDCCSLPKRWCRKPSISLFLPVTPTCHMDGRSPLMTLGKSMPGLKYEFKPLFWRGLSLTDWVTAVCSQKVDAENLLSPSFCP